LPGTGHKGGFLVGAVGTGGDVDSELRRGLGLCRHAANEPLAGLVVV